MNKPHKRNRYAPWSRRIASALAYKITNKIANQIFIKPTNRNVWREKENQKWWKLRKANKNISHNEAQGTGSNTIRHFKFRPTKQSCNNANEISHQQRKEKQIILS